MNALSLMGEQGGWPLTMFLTPEGEPFWGGTYFPPEPRWGRPGFPQVLAAIGKAYRGDRDTVLKNVAALLEEGHALTITLVCQRGQNCNKLVEGSSALMYPAAQINNPVILSRIAVGGVKGNFLLARRSKSLWSTLNRAAGRFVSIIRARSCPPVTSAENQRCKNN
jgi:hypothetical protein